MVPKTPNPAAAGAPPAQGVYDPLLGGLGGLGLGEPTPIGVPPGLNPSGVSGAEEYLHNAYGIVQSEEKYDFMFN